MTTKSAGAHRRELEAIQALGARAEDAGEFCLKTGSRLAAATAAEGFWFFLLDPSTTAPIHLEGDTLGTELRTALSENGLALDSRKESSPDLGSGLQEREPRYSVLRPANDHLLVEVALGNGFEADVVLFVGAGGAPRGLLVLLRASGKDSRLKGHRRLFEALTPSICRCLRGLLSRSLADSLPGNREVSMLLGPLGEIEAITPSIRWLWPTREHRIENLPLPVLNSIGLVRRHLRDPSGATSLEAVPLLLWATGERYQVQAHLLAGTDDRSRGLIQLRPMRALDDTENLLRLGLTRREAEVTQACLRGFTNRQAAYLLAVSKHTVEHHLSRVYEKLSLRTRSELAALLLGG